MRNHASLIRKEITDNKIYYIFKFNYILYYTLHFYIVLFKYGIFLIVSESTSINSFIKIK